MGRTIVTTIPESTGATRTGRGDGTIAPPAQLDKYGDALLKLIPAEVIGVYLAMVSILNSQQESAPNMIAFGAVFAFGVFATLFYLYVTLDVKKVSQLLLSTGAFCVWAYSLVPPEYPFHNGLYSGLLLLAYTFMAPKIQMSLDKQGT